MATKIRVVVWNSKDHINGNELNQALQDVFDGRHCPQVHPVPDTGQDCYALVVSSQPLDAGTRVQEIWDAMDDLAALQRMVEGNQ
jgi:hypothetical protein